MSKQYLINNEEKQLNEVNILEDDVQYDIENKTLIKGGKKFEITNQYNINDETYTEYNPQEIIDQPMNETELNGGNDPFVAGCNCDLNSIPQELQGTMHRMITGGAGDVNIIKTLRKQYQNLIFGGKVPKNISSINNLVMNINKSYFKDMKNQIAKDHNAFKNMIMGGDIGAVDIQYDQANDYQNITELTGLPPATFNTQRNNIIGGLGVEEEAIFEAQTGDEEMINNLTDGEDLKKIQNNNYLFNTLQGGTEEILQQRGNPFITTYNAAFKGVKTKTKYNSFISNGLKNINQRQTLLQLTGGNENENENENEETDQKFPIINQTEALQNQKQKQKQKTKKQTNKRQNQTTKSPEPEPEPEPEPVVSFYSSASSSSFNSSSSSSSSSDYDNDNDNDYENENENDSNWF